MSTHSQPFLRRATWDDFDALYTIWMQDHVIPFMTFEKSPKKQFKLIFETMMNDSEVYVIEDKGFVVATRRIIPNTQEHAHSVELASFGVHQDHLKKKYGKLCYQLLIEKIKKEKPEIKRIEIGQETDNEIAFYLAKKMGFETEMILPDWVRRQTGPGEYKRKWNVGARFMVFILDPTFVRKTVSKVKVYSPKLPALRQDQKIKIEKENRKASCYYKNKLLGVCSFTQGVNRLSHIQFWKINLESDYDLHAMAACLRSLACDASQQCKKIEMCVADKKSQKLVEMLGFHCRGKKTGSCKIDNIYYDEIAVDLSFFNIHDAKELVGISIADEDKIKGVLLALNQCQKDIQNALSAKQIDQYMALYLENKVFQMIRNDEKLFK